MNVAATETAIEHLPRLSTSLISDMHAFIKTFETLSTAILQAKQRWPKYQFVLCSEYDMGEREPFGTFDAFSSFLISADLGCASLTYDPQKSVGLVIAEHEPDE